jgi:hypothetical protein
MDSKECERLLNHYEVVVLTLHECHKRYAFIYQRLSNLLTFLNIVLGTITGTSSISIYNTNDHSGLELMNIILVYIITVLTSCQKIIDPSKKYERFRNASEEYLTMFYDIKYKTTFELQIEEDLKHYIKQLNIDLEDKRVKFPFINDNIYDNYKDKMCIQKRVYKDMTINIPLENLGN